jgi:hypothetical protein
MYFGWCRMGDSNPTDFPTTPSRCRGLMVRGTHAPFPSIYEWNQKPVWIQKADVFFGGKAWGGAPGAGRVRKVGEICPILPHPHMGKGIPLKVMHIRGVALDGLVPLNQRLFVRGL